MKSILLRASIFSFFLAALRAQAPGAPEPLSRWMYFKELAPPRLSVGVLDFVLDQDMLDRSRTDAADIRLYDSAGREIPYVLRVLRAVETEAAYPAREFNRSAEGDVAQASYDLGGQPQEHNEVQIDTAGDNFRRMATVQGSADAAEWHTLASGTILFRFTANGRAVDQQSVSYPVSRYRYLRVRVDRDPQVDRGAPEIKSVRIRRSLQRKGEMATFSASIEGRDADRVNGRPGSVWRIDFGGRIPLERLIVITGDAAFSRPFHLESIDDPSAPVTLASGEITRQQGSAGPSVIQFPEQFVRRVKLTVTDDRNPPLTIAAVSGESAARDVIFEAAAAGAAPLRVYYGNPGALAPHYDLAARLPVNLSPPPVRIMPGPQRENPAYRPEAKPLSERWPWLVYVVLAAAVVVLGGILLSLVRASRKGVPAQ